MTVYQTYIIVGPLSELYACHILEPEDSTVAFRTDDHILVVSHILISSAIFQYISECILRFCSECSGRCLKVLLCEHG